MAGEAADGVLRMIEADLLKNPECGSLVPGLGGVRKARQANPRRGKGKRGGFRYLYMYFVRDQQIFLLYILDKNEQQDLTHDQRKWIRAMAESESKG